MGGKGSLTLKDVPLFELFSPQNRMEIATNRQREMLLTLLVGFVCPL